MYPNITKSEVAKFFRETRGRVPVDALVKAFGVDKPGKTLRLNNVLEKLKDEGVVVKFPNSVFQYAEYAQQTAVETNEKGK